MSRFFMKMAFGPIALMLVMLALLNVATATDQFNHLAIRAEECQSQDIQSCKLLSVNNDSLLGPLINALGSTLTEAASLIGISCTPINILGLTQSKACTGKPLCCSNRQFKGGILGAISVGCVPINIGQGLGHD